MRCPVCGGLYIYYLENVYTCVEGHKWAWAVGVDPANDEVMVLTTTVLMPTPNKWITLTIVRSAGEQEISTWEGEGGR